MKKLGSVQFRHLLLSSLLLNTAKYTGYQRILSKPTPNQPGADYTSHQHTFRKLARMQNTPQKEQEYTNFALDPLSGHP